ncbi:MAG: FRG domain-containing protein [Panacibacter sp.]
MKTICVNNYDEILELRTAYNQKFENAVLFRGTSNPLLPSLVEKCSFKTYEDLAYKEFKLLSDFNSFSNIEYKYQNEIPLDWEIRIAAREHGLASSLMDWSNNLEIAMEFAIHNFQNKNIDFTSVWFLIKSNIDQIDINELTKWAFNDIDKPMLVNYNLSADYSQKSYARRKFIQGGFFLKQPYFDISKPLNQNIFFYDSLLQIIISKNVVPNIWNSLSKIIDLGQTAIPSGVNNYSTEPLDNVCQELNSKYR